MNPLGYRRRPKVLYGAKHIERHNVHDNRVAASDCPFQNRPAPRLRFTVWLYRVFFVWFVLDILTNVVNAHTNLFECSVRDCLWNEEYTQYQV